MVHRATVASDDRSKFKVILPFLKATVVTSDGFDDVNLDGDVLAASSGCVIIGSKQLAGRVDLATLALPAGFAVPGSVTADRSGRSVSYAGDINGDTYDDLIIGVPFASRCYVLFGTEQGFVDMTEGFTIFGAQSSDLTGWSVSGAGDVNNDTFADIIIGAPRHSVGAGSRGVSYVLFGRQSGFRNVQLSAFSSEDGYALVGAAGGDCSGLSVSGAGMLRDLTALFTFCNKVLPFVLQATSTEMDTTMSWWAFCRPTTCTRAGCISCSERPLCNCPEHFGSRQRDFCFG